MSAILALIAVGAALLWFGAGDLYFAQDPGEEGARLPEEAEAAVLGFWAAFSEGDVDAMAEHLIVDHREARQPVLDSIAAEHHITRDARLLSGFSRMTVSVRGFEERDNGFLVTASIGHPGVQRGDTAPFSRKLEDQVLAIAGADERVDLREVFSDAADDYGFDRVETRMQMLLERIDEAWLIVQMDDPAELFCSFAALFESAVCDGLAAALIELDEENRMRPDSPAYLSFRNEVIVADGGHLRHFECLLPRVGIELADGRIVPAGDIVRALEDHPFEWDQLLYELLGFEPMDFLYRGQFVYDSRETRVAFALQRPYAAVTIDSVTGCADLAADDVQVLQIVPGPVDELVWSPDGRYLAAAWTQAGKGNVDVCVYDIEGDERISLVDLLDNEEQYEPVMNMEWSEDSKVLLVDVGVRDQVTTWQLNVDEGQVE